MKLLPCFTAVAALLAPATDALERHRPGIVKRQSATKSPFKVHTFDQQIDHFPKSSRYVPHTTDTFKQRYIYDASFYKPGGPVFLYIGGETSLESRLENIETGIIKILMEATNGLGIILENRYYGDSHPFPTSTTDQLRFMTTEQTVADNAHFAQHAMFPDVPHNGSLNSPHSAWILYGGSLAGSLTAISLHEYGGDAGILWGGIAASGTTKAMLEYPQWYAPIEKFAPQDCVASINGIVEKIDQVFDSKNAANIHKMKSVFGLESLVDGDFAQTIAFPLGGPFNYPTNTWQELGWAPNKGIGSEDFFRFCDNVTNLEAPAKVTAIDDSLASLTNGESWTNLGNYATYIKQHIIPICKGAPINTTACFSTQNQTFWADTTNGDTRSYLYTTCAESGLYQVAPKHGPSLVANPLKVSYTQQWCTWAFPPGKHNSIPSTPDLERINKYGGFNVSQDRLAHIDGNQDVWLDICFHSNLAPERLSPNTQVADLHPQQLITGGGHHWDSYGLNGLAGIANEPQFIQNAHLWEIRTVKRWMMDWKKHGFNKSH